jgi:Carboxypeptidase regulatory-like domain/TonB dependent receptor
MKHYLPKFVFLLLIVVMCGLPVAAQVTTVGSITGTVKDPQGAVVPNASITVKNNATGLARSTTTSEEGIFTVPQLPTGVYNVTIETKSGFKKSEVTGVKVDVGTPTAVNVALELGSAQETVTIIGGGEVLQTQTANIGNTITGRQITELPFTSRDALDLVLNLPGTQTPARPRSSTINGLPKGALTITMDGLPDQAEDSKSSDGFFTFVRPRIDAIEEVSLSSAVPGAESSGDGATQIKFQTRSGGRDFHGSGYWYHRNTSLNSNYYFSNLVGSPRQRMLLNQPGVRVSGPILFPHLLKDRDKAQFFVNYEEFRIPGSTARTRTVLNPLAETGVFRWLISPGSSTPSNCSPITVNGASQLLCGVNLYNLAASKSQTSTVDPIIGSTIAAIRGTLGKGALTDLCPAGGASCDPNRQSFTWNSPASQVRKFSTVRLDFNLTKKHHLENVWNYNVFISFPDQLNSRDSIFPGLEFGVGGQDSDRFSDSLALRSTFTHNIVNELRVGVGAGGTVLFFPETNAAAFAPLGGYSPSFGVFSLTSPASGTSSSRNHAPVKTLLDNLSWVRGNHSWNFGAALNQYNTYAFSITNVVSPVTFAFNAADPANTSGMFTNCTGIQAGSVCPTGTNLSNAQSLYALLTGRLNQISGNAYVNENTGKLSFLGDYTERLRQRTMGFYAQDAWRFRPNLTINAGLRWEVPFPWVVLNKNYSTPSFNGVFGSSGGPQAIFKPGPATAPATAFVQLDPNTYTYKTDWNNLAPSLGFAWSPSFKNSLFKHLFGDAGQSVLRGGYSIAFVREGSNVFSTYDINPGGVTSGVRSIAGGNLTAGTLFRNISSVPAPVFPSSPTYPTPGVITDQGFAFDPNIRTGYVQSWSAGIQRELTKDTALEIRYVGNRGIKLWRLYNINEVNINSNGFVGEFTRAQGNLVANIAAGKGPTFAYTGIAGTSPLPIMLAYFQGLSGADVNNPAKYTASQFSNSSWYNLLLPQNASPNSFACCGTTSLYGASATFRNNALAAGLPANEFIVNPGYLNGMFIADNGGHTYYDSFQIELRRRLSRGLLVQGSYVFSKSISNMFASSSIVQSNYSSMWNTRLNRVVSPWDLTHALKANWIWELPVGRGHWLAGGANGVLDRIVGGWAIHGQARIQSGSTFSFGNVQLVGMTSKDLQKAIKIRKDPNGRALGAVYFLPQDIIDNTIKAFNVGVINPSTPATTAIAYTQGAPTGRYIAPASSNGCIQKYTGACGFSNLVLYGPHLTRFDISLVKKIKVTETVNFEMRGEFLNAFNNINFKIGSQSSEISSVGGFSSSTFGQTSAAYQDLSTTNDVGGRMVQIVLRLTW